MNEAEIAKRCRDVMWADDLAAQALGVDVEVALPGSAVAAMDVRQNMVNGHDLCHGGYLFTLADVAFAFACNTYNRVTVAASASIEFVRPGRLGDRLTATATEAHRGGRTGVYDVKVTNQAGELVAIFRGRSYATREPMLESDT
ncbi:MAG: hydroxyphenylacetyl-CoA thioesterase PaaI [Gammaproteobacteria bacterium]|nr:hydroxyphenylacetyl-CoA thioesterase PaaI [Gammaproteobacteria bacterium]